MRLDWRIYLYDFGLDWTAALTNKRRSAPPARQQQKRLVAAVAFDSANWGTCFGRLNGTARYPRGKPLRPAAQRVI